MKQIIMIALVLSTIATTAFSNTPDEGVNKKVLTSFSRAFSTAQNVNWEIKQQLYKATFKLNGQTIFAYYNGEGQQVAVTRNIAVSQLPLNLASALQGGYNEYWLTDLFEVSTNGETAYYATVETPTTILKADGTSGWVIFKKDKK
jgi:hypothetical protein